VFPLRAECLFVFQPHLLTNPPSFGGLFPHWPLPVLAWWGPVCLGDTQNVSPQCIGTLLGLVPMSPCGLSHRTSFRCHLPLHLRGCPCLVWVVLLPLVAGPRGMPRQPRLDASIRGCLANCQAASAAWHSLTCQGLAAARAAAPSISRAPLLRDGLLFIPVAGGCAPWPGQEGRVLICLVAAVRGPRPLATFSSFAACSRRWSAPPVRGCYPLLVRSRACYPPSSGGGLW
jgi:hypothetical protein